MLYPVSVCMIAKNEGKHMEECLKHLMPYDMEILVADTGSTDKTKEIALKYTDKVYDFAWVNDFSAARNFCASKASNDWILVVDCDEYVEKLDKKLLNEYMQKAATSAGKIRIRNLARRNNGEATYVDEDIIRIYNKKYYEFDYPIHENVVPKKDAGIQLTCFQAPIVVIHHGYNIDEETMKKKQERNLELLYKALENDPDRQAYTYFQIGQSLQVLGDINKAIESYEKSLSIDDDTSNQYVQMCITQLATAYAQIDKPKKAVEVMERYNERIKTARFTYTYGLALLGIQDFLKALMQLVLATTMPDKDTLGEDLLQCYQYIIKLYQMYGEIQMAKDFEKRYEEIISGKC